MYTERIYVATELFYHLFSFTTFYVKILYWERRNCFEKGPRVLSQWHSSVKRNCYRRWSSFFTPCCIEKTWWSSLESREKEERTKAHKPNRVQTRILALLPCCLFWQANSSSSHSFTGSFFFRDEMWMPGNNTSLGLYLLLFHRCLQTPNCTRA